MSPQNKGTKKYQLQVVIEIDEDDKYVAWCPALEACYTQGDTFEEAIENVQDVVAICLEEMQGEDHRARVATEDLEGRPYHS